MRAAIFSSQSAKGWYGGYSGRQRGAAQDYLQTALRQAETFPYLLEQAEIQRLQAMMLIDRSAPGDRETAQKSLAEALEGYARMAMRRHVELTQALMNQTAIKAE